jgi:hypothetical protein
MVTTAISSRWKRSALYVTAMSRTGPSQGSGTINVDELGNLGLTADEGRCCGFHEGIRRLCS